MGAHPGTHSAHPTHHEHHHGHHHGHHHSHHTSHDNHPDHGLPHPLHLTLHPHYRRRNIDHVDEQLDTHYERSQSRRFLKRNFHKIDRHASYADHVRANEYHSNNRMQHHLNATERRKRKEAEQQKRLELAMSGQGGGSSRPTSRAARRRNMRAKDNNEQSVWCVSDTSLSSSSEDGDSEDDTGNVSSNNNAANDDRNIDLSSIEAAIAYDIGVGVGGGKFGVETLRRNKQRAGQRMMLRSSRGRRSSTTPTASMSSSNKIAQTYARSIENDAEQKKATIKKKHFLRERDRVALAAQKVRIAQTREKRSFFGEFRMRDVHRQKLNKTPLRRRSKIKVELAAARQPPGQNLRINAAKTPRAKTTERHGAVPFVERRSKTITVLPLGVEPRPARPPSQLRAPLYCPGNEYMASLDPDSYLYSPTKGERHQRQLLIDIYLDACNELGIMPEPLIVSACNKQDQLNNAEPRQLEGSDAEPKPIKIDKLDLSSKSLGNKAVIALCTALSHAACHVHYRLISLEGNRLTDVGAQAISTLVGTHDTVEELLLGRNRLHTVSEISWCFFKSFSSRSPLTFTIIFRH